MSDKEYNNETDDLDLNDPLLRENEEPSENYSPMPVFLLFIFAALCFWGGIYLVHFDGEFSTDAYTLDYDPKAGVEPVKIDLFARGKRIYTAQCVACHQANGQGVAGAFPPLVGSEWVLGHKEVLARILINGMNGPVEVLGNQYNGNMPAFGPSGLNLKPLDIASVLTYIRQEWGNEGSEFPVEVMERYMVDYSARTTPWTAEEIVQDLSPEPEPVIEETLEEMPEADGEDAPPEVKAPEYQEKV